MFCSRARNWYESTLTSASSTLADDTEAKYARMKLSYKSLSQIKPDKDSLA